MRVLIVARLSRAADESTSIERQREKATSWANAYGHDIVGEAIDNGVSGATDPFKREGLGEWLKAPKLDTWDIAVAWKIDRYGRSVREFLELCDFVTAQGKQIVATDDNFDTTTPQGRLMATIISAMAEWERHLISSRAAESQAKLRSLGRVHGGTAPFGYKTVRTADGTYLEPDPETAPTVREMVDKRLDGLSQRQIAVWLNEKEVPPRYGKLWRQTSVGAVLKSRALVGQRMHKGRTVTDENGVPIQFGEPLIPFDKFEELRAYEESQSTRRGPLTGEPYLLRSILHCGSCGEVTYRNKRGGDRPYYYVCSSDVRSLPCEAPQRLRAELAEGLIERLFLSDRGQHPVLEPVFVPGEDHTKDLADARKRRDELADDRARGYWDDDADGYHTRMRNLTDRIKELSALPQRPDTYEMRLTGEIYADRWMEADVEGQLKLLADTGMRAWICPEGTEVCEFAETRTSRLTARSPRVVKELFATWGDPENVGGPNWELFD